MSAAPPATRRLHGAARGRWLRRGRDGGSDAAARVAGRRLSGRYDSVGSVSGSAGSAGSIGGPAASGGVSTGSRRRPTSAGPPGSESTVGSEPTAARGLGHRRWGLEETGPAAHGGRDRHDDGPGRARQGEAAGIRLIGRGEGHGHDGSLDDGAERRVGVDADLPGERDSAQAQLTLDGGDGPGGELTEVESRRADPGSRSLDDGGGVVGDGLRVGAGDALERLEGAERDAQVGMTEPVAQLDDGTPAIGGVGLTQRGDDRLRDRQRAHLLVAALREVDLPGHLDVTTGRLAWVLLPNPVEDVVVELAQRHEAVLVAVRLAGLQAVDDGRGEDRRLDLVVAGQGRALERVLHGARGADHRAPAAAAEAT